MAAKTDEVKAEESEAKAEEKAMKERAGKVPDLPDEVKQWLPELLRRADKARNDFSTEPHPADNMWAHLALWLRDVDEEANPALKEAREDEEAAQAEAAELAAAEATKKPADRRAEQRKAQAETVEAVKAGR